MADIAGTGKGEILRGTREDDVIEGAGGDDELYGDAGFDHLAGGEGADHLDGGADTDTAEYRDSRVGVAVDLSSGKGYFGPAEGDTLVDIENVTGSQHADLLIGDSEQNTLAGGDGNDTLKGMGGADHLFGGDGIDTASYSESPQGVGVSLLVNYGSFGDAEGDQFNGIENLYGSDHGDLLVGDDGVNILWGVSGSDELSGHDGHDTLWGGWGHDTLYGGAGDDTLIGGEGNDFLVGDPGDDTMIGGIGNDRYHVEEAGDVVIEYGGQGIDEVVASASWTLPAGADVEMLGTIYEDEVAPIDLTGNSSGNVVSGNAGNNVLDGGGGNDELIGLDGQDSFLFATAPDAATNVDTIADFDVADDLIHLDDAVFGALQLGGLPGGQFVVGAAAQDANDYIIYNSATGALLYDSDGAGGAAAIQFAEVTPGLGVSNQDFIVV
jgi:Ca2+-binding RTX toxin-like protein